MYFSTGQPAITYLQLPNSFKYTIYALSLGLPNNNNISGHSRQVVQATEHILSVKTFWN